jgi:hypothetical protein
LKNVWTDRVNGNPNHVGISSSGIGFDSEIETSEKRLCFLGQFLIIAAGLIYISLAHLSSPTDFYILWKANIPAPMLRIFQIWI